MKITRHKVKGVTRIQELDAIEKEAGLEPVATVTPAGGVTLAIYPVQVVVMFLEQNGPIPDQHLLSRCKEFAGDLNKFGDPLVSIEAAGLEDTQPESTL